VGQFLQETGVSLGADDEGPFEMRLLHFRRTFVEKMFGSFSISLCHCRGGLARNPVWERPEVLLGECRARRSCPLGGHGGASGGGRLRCFVVDQVGQARYLVQSANPILQIVPEAHAELSAGLLQTGKRVAAATARVVARAPADLASFDEFPDVRLHGIGVLGDFRMLQLAQLVRFVVAHLLQHTVEVGIAGPLLHQGHR